LTSELELANGAIDQQVISGAKQGDSDCFESLYRHHKRYVYSLCLRITRNQADAEDLTQEVFLQVFRKVATFRGDSAFLTWLHCVALNVVLKHLRKKKRVPVVLEPLESDNTTTTPKWQVAAADYTFALFVDRILLERCISQLPPGYRRTFLLHHVEGYEHEEIATMMRCSVGNSKSQLHKARLKMRAHFKPARMNPVHPQTVQRRVNHQNLLAA
jgi:RNA polymerase sigma-70 factor, ECF subfamily